MKVSLVGELVAARMRSEFPVAEECVWLLGGVVNPVAQSVATRIQDELSKWFRQGAPHVIEPDLEAERRSRLVESLASSVGSAGRDVALVRGVGEGYQTLLRGIDWHPGDRVLLSDDEHPALLLPTLHLARASGVTVDVVAPAANGVYRAEDFAERITPRTRLVAFSEVTTEAGSRLPAGEIAERARAAGCLTFVDLAHSAGLGTTDVVGLGCDAAGVLSYKWHYGPYGLGLLYLSERARERVGIRYPGARSEQQLAHPSGPYTLRDGTQAYQFGPWQWAMVAGWAWAVEQLGGLGFGEIAAHTARMTSRLKRGLLEIGGVAVATPLAAEHSAALVSLSVAGYSSLALRDALWTNYGVRAKARQNSAGIRVGICHFTNDDDLDRLLDGVQELARRSPGAGMTLQPVAQGEQ